MVANDLQIYLQVKRLFFRFVFPGSATQSCITYGYMEYLYSAKYIRLKKGRFL